MRFPQLLSELMSTTYHHGVGLTYDDFSLVPDYSTVAPGTAQTAGRFSRHITLQTPIVSAAMSTVTEAKMAIAMAKAGGIGVIHPAMSIDDQARMVRKVKLHLHARIDAPITVRPEQTMQSVIALREEKDYGFSTFPVVGEHEIPVGLITSRDLRMHHDSTTTVAACMKPFDDLVCGDATTTLEQAQTIMQKHHVNVLLLIGDDGRLVGMYTGSDVDRALAPHTNYTLDAQGHLRVAASIGFGDDALARAEALAKYGCDAFVVGTAHGDSKNVIATVKKLKSLYPHIDVVAGNVSYAEGAVRLVEAGADGILVGQGPGSICTTRVIAGIGIPQATAVYMCVRALKATSWTANIPVIADGGISNSGQIVKALALGAEAVMLGSLLAGTDEAPGEVTTIDGQPMRVYFGMGSQRAMRESEASRKRYGQQGIASGKRTAEGIEGYVPYRGPVENVLNGLIGGLQSGMGYLGAATLQHMQNARAMQITAAGLAEAFPHHVRTDQGMF